MIGLFGGLVLGKCMAAHNTPSRFFFRVHLYCLCWVWVVGVFPFILFFFPTSLLGQWVTGKIWARRETWVQNWTYPHNAVIPPTDSVQPRPLHSSAYRSIDNHCQQATEYHWWIESAYGLWMERGGIEKAGTEERERGTGIERLGGVTRDMWLGILLEFHIRD